MPNRHGQDDDYRYGFQNQEKDDEVYNSEGTFINYKYRGADTRIGRFFAVDPLAHKYPYYSSYQFSGNRLIDMVELEGLEPGRRYPGNRKHMSSENQKLYDADNNFNTMAGQATVKSLGNTVVAVYHMVTNPKETVVGAYDMVSHPIDSYTSFKNSLGDWYTKMGSDDDAVRAEATGQLLAFGVEAVATGGITKITSGMSLVAKIGVRKNLAKSFLSKQGKGLHHMNGINFDKPVSTTTLKKGTVVQQWVGENGVGNYFTPLENGAKKNLGIDYEGRTLKQFTLTEDVKVLKSTASDFEGKTGGGTQYFSKKVKENVKP